MASTSRARKSSPNSSDRSSAQRAVKSGKERVLIEFPAASLRRADEAARAEGVSRSEFIRMAVEQSLVAKNAAKFDEELAAACIANSKRNLELLEEFESVDREGF
jgi:metal-responsive CopG/Arc/MetJ family transcriptional regulator